MGLYRVIGIMSGSSMDGVDLAYCELSEQNGNWSYAIHAAETIPYEMKWRNRLSQLYKQTAMIYAKTDAYYGRYIGELVNDFIKRHRIHADFIASHGHTVFHSPSEGYTSQIGHGAFIHAATGLPVVSDFRTTDVALGGEGAPLVPIGDKYLFGDYGFCLNLGGFANITANSNGTMHAFDIAPCNIVLNRTARLLELEYDENGNEAAKGTIEPNLLADLNAIEFYTQPWPKSLNREWINKAFWTVAKNYRIPPQDKLATLCEHIAIQIAHSIDEISRHYEVNNQKLLVTGGGAFNTFLIQKLEQHCAMQVHVPDNVTVNFKEALIFAFLGVLRVLQKNNCLSSVTGAETDNTGGAMFGKFNQIAF
ncbi:MAG: anhydro-N-acetylmuramic acid kinase [Bacteroidia bacterium]|nr:anhydro-N-acetylmuramic acid kinase [Bacteroidia bacterium]